MVRGPLDEEVTRCVRTTPPRDADATVVRALVRPPALGDVIAGKYRLARVLGRGGMARIYAADHLLLASTVALKFMHPHLARDPAQVARFSREARAAATLQSEHAVRIIDVDQLPTGELYIVMEYLDGTSLDALASAGPLPIADAVGYVVQACDALAEAHSRSIIHRDVKPANLFLTTGKSGEPVIKVLDFGLAKSTASTDEIFSSPLTLAGQSVGTPHYMAPEQITGRSVIDARSDVWALGATLYELLSGRLAFGGASAPIVFDKILERGPTPLRSHRPELGESLVAIVDRCLERDPAARFQTVRDLSAALEAWLAVSEAVSFVAAPLSTDRFVRTSAPPSLPPSEVNLSLRPSVMSVAPRARVSSVWPTVLAALTGPFLLALAAGIAFWITGTPVGSNGEKPRTLTPHEPAYVTATSGDTTRAKASPENHERLRKP